MSEVAAQIVVKDITNTLTIRMPTFSA